LKHYDKINIFRGDVSFDHKYRYREVYVTLFLTFIVCLLKNIRIFYTCEWNFSIQFK